jgi:adenosylcobinamide-phosphate synthase
MIREFGMAWLRDPFIFMACALALDLVLGDPVYAWHPVRLTGRALAWGERGLRAIGLDGRFGGFLLFLWLAAVCGGGAWLIGAGLRVIGARVFGPGAAMAEAFASAWDLFLAYSLLALGDLAAHGRRIARAAEAGDLPAARRAAGMLVGRDTDRMDAAACNRAAVESLSENFVDGVLSPLFWLALFGLPGLIVFKIASTMDSMVGYKDARYLRFGWFGARLDDVMNWIPARLSLALLAAAAALLPGCSAVACWRIGLAQHAWLPGPNKGWSETAAAGALGIRLAGPIWKDGILVNEKWIGDPDAPEGGRTGDVTRMIRMAFLATALFMASAGAARLSGFGYASGFGHKNCPFSGCALFRGAFPEKRL